MLALDQNSSMIEMAAQGPQGQGHRPRADLRGDRRGQARHGPADGPGRLGRAHRRLLRRLARDCHRGLPPDKGMLVRVEKSGSPKNKVGGPMGEIEPGWWVEKIKLMGADAVKLLAPFEPGEPVSAEHQFSLIEHVYSECKKYDILFLLETGRLPLQRREEDRQSVSRPQGRDGHRVGPSDQPVLRHLQG